MELVGGSSGADADDDCFHGLGFARRHTRRQHRVQDAFRRRIFVVRNDADPEPHLNPYRSPVPGALRMTTLAEVVRRPLATGKQAERSLRSLVFAVMLLLSLLICL